VRDIPQAFEESANLALLSWHVYSRVVILRKSDEV